MSYRDSHAAAGYGQVYSKTYERGYYAAVWRDVEEPLVRSIFNELRGHGARSHLDFACGTGRVLMVGATVFPRAVGVDVSEPMLEVARQRCINAELLRRDITREPLTERFDVVSAFRFFLNAEPALRVSVLRAIRSAMNDDGHLLLNIHVNRSSPLGLAYRTRNFLRRRVVGNTLGLRDFLPVLAAEGFSVAEVRWYGLYPRTGPWGGTLAEWMVPRVERVFRDVRAIPRSWAQAFMILCRRRQS